MSTDGNVTISHELFEQLLTTIQVSQASFESKFAEFKEEVRAGQALSYKARAVLSASLPCIRDLVRAQSFDGQSA